MLQHIVERIRPGQPRVGTAVTLKNSTGEALAGREGRISYVWPRFRSGDYLVTVKLSRPVCFERRSVSELDLFLSELELATTTTAAPRSQRHTTLSLARS